MTGEKREWCSSFSFYDPQQDDPYGLENSLNGLLDLAYRGGVVPVNYGVVYQSIGKDDIALRKASKKELSNLSDHQLVSILGYQFRDDYFDNGSWIRTYVAKGLAYHYFHELAARWGCL